MTYCSNPRNNYAIHNGVKVKLNEIYVGTNALGKLDIDLGYQRTPTGIVYAGHYLGFPKYMDLEDLERIEKYASEKICEFFKLKEFNWDVIQEICWEQHQKYINKLKK